MALSQAQRLARLAVPITVSRHRARARRAQAAASDSSGAFIRGIGPAAGARERDTAASSTFCTPWPLRALVPTTGTPNREESRGRSRVMPCFFASSSRFTTTTTRGNRAMICKARGNVRSRQPPSQRTTITSASLERTNSRVTLSSSDMGVREYAPGVSTSVISRPFSRAVPRALATVLPVQFPVCWRSPVRALNRVLLPTLGLPASPSTRGAAAVSVLFTGALPPRRRHLFHAGQ